MYVTQSPISILDIPVIYRRADSSSSTSSESSSATTSTSSESSSAATSSSSSSKDSSGSSSSTDSSTETSSTDSSSTSSSAAGTTISFSVTTSATSFNALPSGSSISSNGQAFSGLPTISKGYTLPTVTVPMMDNNPYIHRTTNPSGTVFIAIGSIMGFALLIALFIWLYTVIANRMNASNGYFNNMSKSGFMGLSLGSPSQNKEGGPGGNSDYPLEKQQYANFLNGSDVASTVLSQHGGASVALSAMNTNNNLTHTYTNVSGNPFSEASFATNGNSSMIFGAGGGYENNVGNDLHKRNSSNDIDTLAVSNALLNNNNNRSSMFISPTAELLNKRNLHASTFEPLDAAAGNELSNITTDNNPPSQQDKGENLSYPQKANISVSSVNLTTGRKGRTTPSMYLENMFDQASNASSN